VVPHNTKLLELAECHINVEFSFTVNVIPYLYKYIFKGPDHVQAAIHSQNDEIQNYVYSRYICASEAAWRIQGYPIHPRRLPAVGTLPVHVEGKAYVTFVPDGAEPDPGEDSAVQTRSTIAADKHVLSNSKLEYYLMRPAEALDKRGNPVSLCEMSYLELYNEYEFVTTSRPKKKHTRTRAITDLFIYPRATAKVHRMWVKRPSAGEDFYLRLLLANKPSTVVPMEIKNSAINNDEVLRWAWNKFRGEGFHSFQERVSALGLLTGDNEYVECFTEAITGDAQVTGRHARQLFVTVVFEGASSIDLWRKFGEPDTVALGGQAGDGMPLFSDFYERLLQAGNPVGAVTVGRARQLALVDIARRLEYFNKTMDEFGLPIPEETESEIARARSLYQTPTGSARNFQREGLAAEFDAMLSSLNSADGREQRAVFYRIVGAVMSRCPVRMYLGGKSGRGKTWLMNAVTAYLRLQGKVVLCCASTGIASINHTSGYTAHNLFKIPVEAHDVDTRAGLSCCVNGGSSRGDLLAEADLIIWDEFAMSNKRDVQAVSDLLQQLRRNPALFGGVSFVGVGDVHQIPPVIPYATDPQVLAASVVSWVGWALLERLELTHPHRDGTDKAHSAFVDKCGTGLLSLAHADSQNNSAGFVRLEGLAVSDTLEDLIKHVYPQGDATALEDPGHAILTCRNKDVDEINNQIAETRLDSAWHELYSSDELQDQDPHDPLNMFGADFLNMLENPGQFPPHRLRLKVGAKVMLMRNLSAVDKLMNGTMGIVRAIHTFRILVCTSTGTHVIPRINFTINIKRCNYTVNRRQFPLRLAYCKTVNKSQGSTMKCLGLDLRQHPFAHGQLYVAVGRSRDANSVSVLVRPEMREADSVGCVTGLTLNVVMADLLEHGGCKNPLEVLPHPGEFEPEHPPWGDDVVGGVGHGCGGMAMDSSGAVATEADCDVLMADVGPSRTTGSGAAGWVPQLVGVVPTEYEDNLALDGTGPGSS
jgi:hypothetical protein